MNWKSFLVTIIIASTIIYLQWPKMKDYPTRDKAVLIGILIIVLVLSMFQLNEISGPLTVREKLLKPFDKYMQK